MKASRPTPCWMSRRSIPRRYRIPAPAISLTAWTLKSGRRSSARKKSARPSAAPHRHRVSPASGRLPHRPQPSRISPHCGMIPPPERMPNPPPLQPLQHPTRMIRWHGWRISAMETAAVALANSISRRLAHRWTAPPRRPMIPWHGLRASLNQKPASPVLISSRSTSATPSPAIR